MESPATYNKHKKRARISKGSAAGGSEEVGASLMPTGDPLASFKYAIRRKGTKIQYYNRLKNYFDFVKIPGNSLEEQANNFLARGKKNKKWAQDCIIRYVTFQKELVEGSFGKRSIRRNDN